MGAIKLGISDITIILLFFFFVATIGYFVSTKKPSAEQLFFAGRKLTWPIIGFSLLASNISTLTMLGLTADSFTHGIATSSYEWMATLILVFSTIFIVPIYFKHKIKTVPEFFGMRFGRRVRSYISVINLIIGSTVNIAGPMYAGAVLINIFLPEISVYEACIGIGIFAGFYTALGGLSAVVFTDFFQAILFIMISMIIGFAVFAQFDFDISRIYSVVPTSHFNLIKPLNDEYMPWLGLVTGVPILGIYFWCTDQVIIQRIIAARDLQQARYGMFFGALLKLSILFIIVFPGIMAVGLFSGLDNHNDLYGIIISRMIPAGVLGLVLAGLIAAMMSSIDSALNSSATLIVYDFIHTGKKPLSERRMVTMGRVVVILIMFVSLLWTPIIDKFGGIWAYSQTMLTYFVSPLVALFVMAIFSKKGEQKSALIALISGHSLSVVVVMLNFTGQLVLHFTLIAPILFFTTIISYHISSILIKNPIQSSLERISIRNQWLGFKKDEFGKLSINFYLGLGLVLLTLIIILPFLF